MLDAQAGRWRRRQSPLPSRCADGLHELIGNTPLVFIKSLSDATRCKVQAVDVAWYSASAPVLRRQQLAMFRAIIHGTAPLLRQILGKAEFLNPGGSVKDRVALEVIREATASGRLQRGGLVTEGTVGSTGVSLAMVAAARGLRCFIAMPDDAAIEKSQMLEALGASSGCSRYMCSAWHDMPPGLNSFADVIAVRPRASLPET